MTATERLRALLDERGVKWWQSVNMLGCVFTRWYSSLFSDEVVAMENGDGELELFSRIMTPEQAVEATLGRGTCRALDGESSSGAPLQARDYDEFWEPAGVCSECGELIPLRNYCPNCGRKVVE